MKRKLVEFNSIKEVNMIIIFSKYYFFILLELSISSF